MSAAFGLVWDPLVPAVVALVGGGVLTVVTAVGAARSASPARAGWLVRLAMAVLATVVVLGPGLPGGRPTYAEQGDLQLLVAVDRTVSMSALDGPGGSSRLDAVRADMAALVDRLQEGSRVALAQFGSSADLVVPFTSDLTAFADGVALLRRESPTEGIGSRVDRPLGLARRALATAREQYPDRHLALLLLSDGENTAPGAQRSFTPLAGLAAGGAVLGYGTEKGARMPVDEGQPEAGWVPDTRRGGPAVSRRDTANLRRLADEAGLVQLDRSSGGPLDEVVRALEPPVRVEQGETAVGRPLTWVVALPLLALTLVELRGGWRGWHEARRLRWAR